MFEWLLRPLRQRQREALLAEPFPESWLPHVERLPFYRALDERGQARIRDDLRVLIDEKNWEGCGGLELTDEIRVTIAAQASLLLLNIEHEYYRTVTSILVYPAAYKTMAQHGADGLVREGQANLGEAWQTGPVILSWDDARRGAMDPHDGHNLVFHEFAHKLDMLNGSADGTPPMDNADQLRRWVATMTSEFERLRSRADEGRRTVMDKYGATNPAEFFAVATECFFEKSQRLKDKRPELYEVLRGYYHQDPASRQ
ncbi:MAG: zinc-dependent peptidase [Planctomycetes bacterium]|nr:zinc-dependent peptidase [Planctomycetota bacterium]